MAVSISTPKDIPTLASIINQAYVGTDEFGGVGWSHEAKIITGPRVNPDNPVELINSEDVCILKYEGDNGEIMGCIRVEKTGGRAAYSGMLSVKPSYQARGVGSSLLTAAEHWANDKGCSCMKLTVVSLRKELIEYYKRRGYEETGETVEFPLRPGCGAPKVPLHLVSLQKKLL